MLRLPEGMRERVKDAATKNNRSMNAEIVARLEASLEPSGGGRLSEQEKEEIWEFLQRKAREEKR